MLAGRPDRAREQLDAELDRVDRKQAWIGRGRALRLLGVLTGSEAGVSLLAESVDVLGATPAELELAYALTDFGAALRRSGRRNDARERLSAAHAQALFDTSKTHLRTVYQRLGIPGHRQLRTLFPAPETG